MPRCGEIAFAARITAIPLGDIGIARIVRKDRRGLHVNQDGEKNTLGDTVCLAIALSRCAKRSDKRQIFVCTFGRVSRVARDEPVSDRGEGSFRSRKHPDL